MNKEKIKGSVAALVSLTVVVCLFFIFTILDSSKSDIMLTITYIGIIVVHVYFISDTVGLLYLFFELDKPWQRFIPVVNEFYAIDEKYKKSAYITLGISILSVIIATLPFSVKALISKSFATSGSFYFFFVAFVFFMITQLIVGIGLFFAINDINKEWERIVGEQLGALQIFKLFALIPILRIYAFYAMRKPLDTMVTFRRQTVSSIKEVQIISDEDEEPYNEDEDNYY